MAETDLDPSILANHSKLFALLDPAGQQRIIDAAVQKNVAAGDVLVREGEAGDDFFILLEGRVEVTVDDLGHAKTVAELGRGAVFGEIATVLAEPRSATVTAKDDCLTLAVGRDQVNPILDD
jgi:CRP-like cAMP-binding protein